MTLQQLKYIIAIDRFRSFAQAAANLEITQPTLSALLVKLEEELGVRIFERNNKTVRPTAIGETIIRQAAKAVNEAEKITELVAEHKDEISGTLAIAVGPSIAPYILPQFISRYTQLYPGVRLAISEMKSDGIMNELQLAKIDAGIAAGGNSAAGVVEIPLYTEPFHVYVSGNCREGRDSFNPAELEHEKMWIMKESQCMRDSAFSFCKARSAGKRIYEAGSIETLVRIVDSNGGFTIIPEMHLKFLSPEQQKNVRPINGDYISRRCVSLYVREDYIRKRMLRSIVDTLITFIPRKMLDDRILADK